MGNSPEVTSDENSYAELDDFCTIPDVPISNGYLTKITAERARRERPDFTAPVATNEVQKALVGKPLEKVVRSAPVIQAKDQAPESTKIIKLDGGRISIIDAIQLFGWKPDTRFAWQLDRSSLTLIAQEDGDLAFDASNRILIPMNLAGFKLKKGERVLKPSLSNLLHSILVAEVRVIYEANGAEWICERAFRTEFTDHLPDGLAVFKDQKIIVEIDRTRKEKNRLFGIMMMNLSNSNYIVDYWSPSDLLETINRQKMTLPLEVRDRLRVFEIPKEAF